MLATLSKRVDEENKRARFRKAKVNAPVAELFPSDDILVEDINKAVKTREITKEQAKRLLTDLELQS